MQPNFLLYLERPSQVPLIQPFFVSGWAASAECIHGIAAGNAPDEWLTLSERPDVRQVHPRFASVVGFSGNVSFRTLDDGRLRLTCFVGDNRVEFFEDLKPVVLPPDHLQVRQVGGVWGMEFFNSGRVMFDQIAALFREAGQPLERAKRILDFGCGCGRVLWTFQNLPHDGEVWGCDIDAEAIAWDCAHLGTIGKFQCNLSQPPTPFVDGFFDAIYSVSVFTHLPEDLQLAWLGELRRILRPGGVLVASLHGRSYWPDDAGVQSELQSRGFAYRTGTPTAGLPDFYMVAYHSEEYVRREWARFFDFVALKGKYIHDAHDAVIVRRRDD